MYGPLESSVDKSFSTLASDNLHQTSRRIRPTSVNLENILRYESATNKKLLKSNYVS